MDIRISCLAAVCALAIAACGKEAPPAEETAATPAETPSEPAPAATPVPTEAPAAGTEAPAATPPATAPAAGDKPAAVVSNCATEIEGNDAMQYNVGSITVPASCTKFTINLKHAGTMPVAAMGHNVVITKAADMQAVAADGVTAGATAGFLKADDARIVAHSDMIGGGQTTSVTFDVAKIKDGGPYQFFCSFPGHAALMKGTIAVG